MASLESRSVWKEIVAHKDDLSLKELANRYGTSPGEISAAFKRTGLQRTPRPITSIDGLDELPPEPGEEFDDGDEDLHARPGSKDERILAYREQLGKIPDADVARMAGVSVRTVASFRARFQIAGYTGPRRRVGRTGPHRSRIDPFADLLGQVPDRVVAERAGVSLNAVRNYRSKRGIAAAGRRVLPSEELGAAPIVVQDSPTLTVGSSVWQVCLRDGASERRVAMIATDLIELATRVQARFGSASVLAVHHVGQLAQ